MRKVITIICMFLFSIGYSQEIFTDYEIALKKAKEENKSILMVFSGSDWCVYCKKLKKNIFDTEEFKKYQKESIVFLEVDFPKKKANKLDGNQVKKNNALAEKYNKEGIFPKVVIISKDEKKLGTLGFEKLKAKAYIDKIKAIVK